NLENALIINDSCAGYRKFLGADPESAAELKINCNSSFTFNETFVSKPIISSLSSAIDTVINKNNSAKENKGNNLQLKEAYSIISTRFYPEMLEKTVEIIKNLNIEKQVPLSEIVILVPFLSDVIRFSLMNELEKHEISAYSHRPSRSLKDEAASRCLLTLAELAHPAWKLTPSKFDILYMLVHSIDKMDLVRAQLLSEIIYQPKSAILTGFEQVTTDAKERITYSFGEKYSQIKNWINSYKEEKPAQPLDHFFRRIFGELLSQPGFGFHENHDSARICSNLIESVQKFRWAMEPTMGDQDMDGIGKEYIAMLREGVISAQYDTSRKNPAIDSILIAPAHTYLMSNRPVMYQFWLDAGSPGWYERLFQPITHPYVLSRHWDRTKKWTDTDEVIANNEGLNRLVNGLLLRCKEKIFIGLTDLSESGYEQRGALIQAFQQIIRFK
ncbi:MAG: hypothetical protein WCP19_14315, partial [Chloroflexota bacterium]